MEILGALQGNLATTGKQTTTGFAKPAVLAVVIAILATFIL